MSTEADTKMAAAVEGLKSNLFEIESADSAEKRALGTFESSQPFSEDVILEPQDGHQDKPKEKTQDVQDVQRAQESADRIRYKRGTKQSAHDAYVQQLTTDNRALQERLAYNNHYHQAEIEHLRSEVLAKNKTTKDLENHSLKVKEEYLVNALIQAKEENNYEAEARLQRSLSAIHADLATSDLRYQVKTQQERPYAHQYNPPPPPQVQQEIPLRPEFAAWLENNSWFDSESPDHDPDLEQEVRGYAHELNKTLRVQGLRNQIDSVGYYEVLDAMIKKKYSLGESQDSDPLPEREVRRPTSVVSPVSRGDASGGGIPVTGRNSVYLTAEQREMALSRTKVHPNGTPYTNNELLQHYAQLVSRLDQHDKDHGVQSNAYKTTLRFG